MTNHMTYQEYLQKVKTGITTESGDCPVTPVLLMLQGKWKNQVLYELCIRDRIRFGEFKKALPQITNTMLASTLRELEADGLVCREQYNEIPLRVEYSFTEKGRDLMPVFYAMTMWGFQYCE